VLRIPTVVILMQIVRILLEVIPAHASLGLVEMAPLVQILMSVLIIPITVILMQTVKIKMVDMTVCARLGLKEMAFAGDGTTCTEIGLALGQYCRINRGLRCVTPNSECTSSRCKCIKARGWLRYPGNGNVCVAQTTLPLGHSCILQEHPCGPKNSMCRAFKCRCTKGTKKTGGECIKPKVST